MKSILLGIDRILFGSLWFLLWANRKIGRTLANTRAKGICDDGMRLGLPSKILEEAFEGDKRRLERIEDKAKNNVFVVAVAISLLSAGIGFYSKDNPLAKVCPFFKFAAAIFLIAATFFLLLSAVLSLRSYRVGEVYYPVLEDRPELSEEKEWRRWLLFCLEMNRKMILIRANCLTSSMNCLVNGVIAISLFFCLVVWSLF